jgi:hypothetical protein
VNDTKSSSYFNFQTDTCILVYLDRQSIHCEKLCFFQSYVRYLLDWEVRNKNTFISSTHANNIMSLIWIRFLHLNEGRPKELVSVEQSVISFGTNRIAFRSSVPKEGGPMHP